MGRLLKWLVVLVLLVGFGVLAIPLAAWWQERSMPKYQTTTVSRGRVETVVNSTGTVKPVRTVSVGAFTSGPIEKVLVDFNSIVVEDQLLAQIDRKLAQATLDRDIEAVKTQKAEAERLKALLDQAVRNEDRATALQAANKAYISDTEYDTFTYTTKTLRAQCRLAEANIAQAEATLKNSEANLKYTEIRAPDRFSDDEDLVLSAGRGWTSVFPRKKGTIIERKIDRGQTIAASFQTPELFTIAVELDKHVYIYASVDEADVGMIQKARQRDLAVKFTIDAYPGVLFDGKIHDVRLNSTTTQNVVTYPVIIDAANRAQKLMPGMTANITFQIEAKEDVLRVPAVALRFTPLAAQVRPEDRHHLEAITAAQSSVTTKRSANEKANLAQSRQNRVVWVQDGPLLRAVPITLGLIENQYAEIVAGDLTEGQAIVTGLEGPLTPR
jgi:HlyD family secretion protein